MMIFLFSGCMRNDRNTITSEKTESEITGDSNSAKAIDNDSTKEVLRKVLYSFQIL